MAKLSLESKARLVNMKEYEQLSYRQISASCGIPKSTLHDNMPLYKGEVQRFFEAGSVDPIERLVRTVLTLSLPGKCSSRDTAQVISSLWETSICHQTVLKIMSLSSEVTDQLNADMVLSNVHSALFDEIFQNSDPLLVFADADSGTIKIERGEDRGSESWSTFLSSLKALALEPESVVTDGGTGLLKSVKASFEKATLSRDLFHVQKKLSAASKAMERHCYHVLGKLYSAQKQGDIERIGHLSISFENAATFFDCFEENISKFKEASYLAHPQSEGCYIKSQDLLGIIHELIDFMDLFMSSCYSHKAIKQALSYLKRGKLEMISYKKKIEQMVENTFGSQYQELVLEFLCPLVEYINQFLRSHDSRKQQRFWGQQIANLRSKFRNYKLIDQKEIDQAINVVWNIGLSKSNSFIESVNSVIRVYLKTYKSIPSWFCSVFTFYWNHRRFQRGKRANISPIEQLYGKVEDQSWVDKIMKHFPLEKLRSSLPAIPGYHNSEYTESKAKDKQKSAALKPLLRLAS